MKLARFRLENVGPSVGAVRDERIVDLKPFVPMIARRIGMEPPEDPCSLLSWIRAGWLAPAPVREIDRIAGDIQAGLACPGLDSVRLLAPVDHPGQIFAVGRNFAAHAREGGAPAPEIPMIFGKAPTSVIGPGDAIVVPPDIGRVDPEAEVAVVLGRGGRRIHREQALEHVAGYTCFNDVTAREMQREDFGKGWPWFRSKGMDTFGPMGPWLVTADEMPTPLDVSITCSVNGQTRQRGQASSMIFDVATVIEFVSRYTTLTAGDLIAMGTPEGVSPIQPGDVVEVAVDRIGVLVNPVVAEDQAP